MKLVSKKKKKKERARQKRRKKKQKENDRKTFLKVEVQVKNAIRFCSLFMNDKDMTEEIHLL